MDNAKIISEKINAGGVYEHFNLPWIRVAENNSLQQNGIQLTWKNFSGGTGAIISSLKKGEIDIGILLTEGLILDIIKNKQLKLVCFHVMNPLRWAIHIRENETISSFGGKRFAVSRIGSGSHTMARFLLFENKVSYDPSVMVEVGSLEGGLKALQENKADIFLWERYTTEPFLTSRHLKSIGEVKTPWPPFSVAVTKEYYEKNKAVIELILASVRTEIQFILNNDLTKEFSRRWQINAANASRWLSEIKWHDHAPVSDEAWLSVIENMKKAGLLESNQDVRLNLINS